MINRVPLLGQLCPLPQCSDGHIARVKLTDLGFAVYQNFNHLQTMFPEQENEEVRKALRLAETGTVTYTAAINEGEKAVAMAVRTVGCPLVVMMLDGFPEEGTENARYFHPSGVYHNACCEGRLYIMAPKDENHTNAELISLTDGELRLKSEAKGFRYQSIPHTTKRWRMIAGNVMLRMIADKK